MPELRELLEKNYDALDSGAAPETLNQPEPAATPAPAAASESDASPAVAEAKGRTAGRARDEQGRLLPGPAVKDAPEPSLPASSPAPAPVVAEAPKAWKAEYKAKFSTLPPDVQTYILQREQEVDAGIGKHRGDAERGRPYVEAMQEFEPELRQYGVDPVGLVKNLAAAHRTLALGDPQSKLQMFAQLAQQYNIPLAGLFVQGQDGKTYFNEQLLRQAPQPRQQQQQPPDVRKVVQEALDEERGRQELASFMQDKDKYPHFERVRADMADLINIGKAKTLPEAYDKAIRLHDDIWTEEQERQRTSSEAERRAAQDKAAKEAKAKALSPRSTPSATLATGNSGTKDRRSILSEAYDSLAGGRL